MTKHDLEAFKGSEIWQKIEARMKEKIAILQNKSLAEPGASALDALIAQNTVTAQNYAFHTAYRSLIALPDALLAEQEAAANAPLKQKGYEDAAG